MQPTSAITENELENELSDLLKQPIRRESAATAKPAEVWDAKTYEREVEAAPEAAGQQPPEAAGQQPPEAAKEPAGQQPPAPANGQLKISEKERKERTEITSKAVVSTIELIGKLIGEYGFKQDPNDWALKTDPKNNQKQDLIDAWSPVIDKYVGADYIGPELALIMTMIGIYGSMYYAAKINKDLKAEQKAIKNQHLMKTVIHVPPPETEKEKEARQARRTESQIQEEIAQSERETAKLRYALSRRQANRQKAAAEAVEPKLKTKA